MLIYTHLVGLEFAIAPSSGLTKGGGAIWVWVCWLWEWLEGGLVVWGFPIANLIWEVFDCWNLHCNVAFYMTQNAYEFVCCAKSWLLKTFFFYRCLGVCVYFWISSICDGDNTPFTWIFSPFKVGEMPDSYKGYRFFCGEHDSFKCNGVRAWAKL